MGNPLRFGIKINSPDEPTAGENRYVTLSFREANPQLNPSWVQGDLGQLDRAARHLLETNGYTVFRKHYPHQVTCSICPTRGAGESICDDTAFKEIVEFHLKNTITQVSST
jgi:hypothetical protein